MVVTATGRLRKLSHDEVDLLKRTVAKGTSDDEFAMFLWVCRNHQVDPVVGEIYCIMRWDSKRDVIGHDENGKPQYQGGMKATIQMGIGGLRGLAARKHKDYGSTDEPVWEFGDRKTPAERKIPESVTVAVWKRGAPRPTKATIFWDEFAPRTLQTEAWKHDFWNHSPANQLAKCCEAQALRKSYPDLNNIYIPEEMARTDEDYTSEGRQIVTQDGTSPSGRPITWEAKETAKLAEVVADVPRTGSREAAQQVLKDKLAGAAKSTEGEPKSESASRAPAKIPDSEYRKENVPPATQGQPWKFAGTVTFDYTSSDIVVTGDVQQLFQAAPQCMTLFKWRVSGFWTVKLADVTFIRQACVEVNFEIVEVKPKSSAPQRTQSAKPTEKRGASLKGDGAPTVVCGTIERVNTGMAGKAPVKYVTLILADKSKPCYGCFHKSLFDDLDKGLGKAAEFIVSVKGKYTNIERLLRVGSKEWDADGTPVIQRSQQEAGQKTLY